jgi:hypothetical protein
MALYLQASGWLTGIQFLSRAEIFVSPTVRELGKEKKSPFGVRTI